MQVGAVAGRRNASPLRSAAEFLIANPRLETRLSHRKQKEATLSNSEFSHVFISLVFRQDEPVPCRLGRRSFSSDKRNAARSAFHCADSPAEGLAALRRAACFHPMNAATRPRAVAAPETVCDNDRSKHEDHLRNI
jgi:hypothetical protein